ncbi:type I methionyl aminopeptidase [Candidatus Pacearchaeota archaeon]|jgi:methionyl aminopeptidase|nr:type I methionyl aminopeptidase [Candidatus Pacearchaeota archaeon]
MALPSKSEIIVLKDKDWIGRQKIAGRVVGKAHQEIYAMFKGMASNLTLSKLNSMVDDLIRQNNCTPTFLNYRGFPSSICASLNTELVHGMGSRNIQLKDGDVLKVDIGATFEGAIGDCAVTYIYGKPKNPEILRLLISCQDALYDAIALVEPGRRIGEIGRAIFDRSKSDGFGVVIEFGGHGIEHNKLHADPFVPNKSSVNDGVTMQPGMSIAIEPMFVLGKNVKTKTLTDKWTVITHDIGCHFEHTITLDEDGNRHIITDHGISAREY